MLSGNQVTYEKKKKKNLVDLNNKTRLWKR